MQKINIIQFLPYFPPHKWWLETVAEELSCFYVSKWYWEIINIVFDVWQKYDDENLDYIFNNTWKKIGYKQKWYIVYLIPAFDIISNFPVPKFWKKEFWEILGIPLSKTFSQWKKGEKYIIQTHTRFFLSSFLWWLFAKYNKLKWVHIEHWSDYVKLWSKLNSKISYIYDRVIGKWIFSYADYIIAISEWVKDFVEKEFHPSYSLSESNKNKIDVIYNWINFTPWIKKDNWDLIKIGFVWRLVSLKWVNFLIESFWDLSKKYKNIELLIVWDGEEKQKLEKYVLENNIKNIVFLWFKNRQYIANEFLSQIDILVNPSYQEWLPTTVLEWLLSKCVVVATNVGGTKEISNLDDLIIVEKWNILELEKWIEKAILKYKDFRWLSYLSIKEEFNWDENIDKYFTLYKGL